MEEKDTSANHQLCEQLGTVDESLRFLVLIILSVLLSFWSVVVQRGQLCCTITEDTEATGPFPPVFPMKIAASALVTGSLGYFLSLALQTCRTAAQGDDAVAQHSASMNVWASLFVFVAALIRLYDLNYVEGRQPKLQQDETLPG